jgi:hypothetical protein
MIIDIVEPLTVFPGFFASVVKSLVGSIHYAWLLWELDRFYTDPPTFSDHTTICRTIIGVNNDEGIIFHSANIPHGICHAEMGSPSHGEYGMFGNWIAKNFLSEGFLVNLYMYRRKDSPNQDPLLIRYINEHVKPLGDKWVLACQELPQAYLDQPHIQTFLKKKRIQYTYTTSGFETSVIFVSSDTLTLMNPRQCSKADQEQFSALGVEGRALSHCVILDNATGEKVVVLNIHNAHPLAPEGQRVLNGNEVYSKSTAETFARWMNEFAVISDENINKKTFTVTLGNNKYKRVSNLVMAGDFNDEVDSNGDPLTCHSGEDCRGAIQKAIADGSVRGILQMFHRDATQNAFCQPTGCAFARDKFTCATFSAILSLIPQNTRTQIVTTPPQLLPEYDSKCQQQIGKYFEENKGRVSLERYIQNLSNLKNW